MGMALDDVGIGILLWMYIVGDSVELIYLKYVEQNTITFIVQEDGRSLLDGACASLYKY